MMPKALRREAVCERDELVPPAAVSATSLSPVAIALILVSFGAMVVFWLSAISCPAAYDYGGGDTATWIWLIRHGRAVYGPVGGLPMLRTNYPPLQGWLVAWLAPSDATILMTGRLLALAGLALSSLMVYVSIEAATGRKRTALFGALLLAGTLRVGYWGLVCRGDALALGLGAAAVTVAVKRVRGWVLFAAPLFAAAALCKHSLIVMPVGLGLWGLWRVPRRAIQLGLLTIALAAIPIFTLHLIDPLFLWSQAPWSPFVFARWVLYAVMPSLVGIVLCLALFRRWHLLPARARRALEPWAVVFGVGIVWTIALGRTGSGSNYVLELCTAMVILAVVAAEEGLFRRLFLLHLSLTAIETTLWVVGLVTFVVPDARAQLEGAHRALAGVEGPILAEQPWHTTSVGRPPVEIPFLGTQLARSGRWSDAPLVQALVHGDIARVLVNFAPDERGSPERFTDAERDAIAKHYVLKMRAGGLYVYAPR